MSKFWDVDQGTAAWYMARLGKPTASNFHKIVTPTGKASRQARDYMYRLVAERLLKDTMDDQRYVEAMEHGKINQPYAERQFELVNGIKLKPVGFVTTNDGRLGCSPDALIEGKPQSVEIKCPYPWTQIGRLIDGLDADYRPQVQGQLLVGEFELVHFYSYHPQMPAFHLETVRDAAFITLLATALHAFCDELDAMTEKARKLGAYVVQTHFETPLEKAYPELSGPDYEIKLP